MEKLKEYLKKSLKEKLSSLEDSAYTINRSLDEIKDLNTSHALYTVSLRSLWSKEGEKDVIRAHRGNLRFAIELAQQEFIAKNRRSDLQADYSVKIRIGNVDYIVPEEYYDKFKQKN